MRGDSEQSWADLDEQWCFLGQIVDYNHFVRLVLNVKDKEGSEVMAAFYNNDRGVSISKYKGLRPGHTPALLYAKQAPLYGRQHRRSGGGRGNGKGKGYLSSPGACDNGSWEWLIIRSYRRLSP